MRFHPLQYRNRNREHDVVYGAINETGLQRLFLWKSSGPTF